MPLGGAPAPAKVGNDTALRVDPPDALVAGVGDVEIARGVEGDAARIMRTALIACPPSPLKPARHCDPLDHVGGFVNAANVAG